MQPQQASHLSFFKPLGYQRNSCGYCKSDDGSLSYYATCPAIKVEHYESLINRGWRRSGNLYYKQNLRESCCPHYTMRLTPCYQNQGWTQPHSNLEKTKNVQSIAGIDMFWARSIYAKLQDCVQNRESAYLPDDDWNRKIGWLLYPPYWKIRSPLTPILMRYREKRRRKSQFELSPSIHETEYVNVKRPVDPATKKPIEPAHRFEVTTESDSFTQEKFHVFLKYQTTIHKERPSRWSHASFKRFLCSGVKPTTKKDGSREKKLGSYHQCYRLDGQLVAVAVLDILPHTVSSVYIFYDPSFGEWEFGKLSAMREIALALEDHYQFYYMGFYIHSCPKMRYKASFKPQYLLDPESLTWNLFDENLSRKLDARPYVSLSRDKASGDGNDKVAGKVQSDTSSTSPSSTADESDRSLFDINMPGVLTRQQLEDEVDLDHWLLLVRGIIVHMEDLVSWEESDITQPHSLKGIIAELAAVLGPEVVRGSVVMLF